MNNFEAKLIILLKFIQMREKVASNNAFLSGNVMEGGKRLDRSKFAAQIVKLIEVHGFEKTVSEAIKQAGVM